jgi:hypothetical protein
LVAGRISLFAGDVSPNQFFNCEFSFEAGPEAESFVNADGSNRSVSPAAGMSVRSLQPTESF